MGQMDIQARGWFVGLLMVLLPALRWSPVCHESVTGTLDSRRLVRPFLSPPLWKFP